MSDIPYEDQFKHIEGGEYEFRKSCFSLLRCSYICPLHCPFVPGRVSQIWGGVCFSLRAMARQAPYFLVCCLPSRQNFSPPQLIRASLPPSLPPFHSFSSSSVPQDMGPGSVERAGGLEAYKGR